MKIKRDVVMLPTKEKTKLYLSDFNTLLNYSNQASYYHTGQHIYITSDEEIKEGVWYVNGKYLYQADRFYLKANNDKKIIATTDKSLKLLCKECDDTGVLETGMFGKVDCDKCNYKNENLHLLVPQIPESFVKAFVESNGTIKEVLVEYENDRECWKARNQFNPSSVDFIIYSLEEKEKYQGVMFDYYPIKLKTNPDNTINISLIEEKMYNKAEVKKLLKDIWNDAPQSYTDLEKWIDDNL